jgi:hypothetical protein
MRTAVPSEYSGATLDGAGGSASSRGRSTSPDASDTGAANAAKIVASARLFPIDAPAAQFRALGGNCPAQTPCWPTVQYRTDKLKAMQPDHACGANGDCLRRLKPRRGGG